MPRSRPHLFRSHRSPLGWTCALVLAAAGCGDGPSDPEPLPVPTALRIVAGDAQADTVDAVVQNLAVVVTDDRGRPSAGVTVEFAGDLAAGSASEPGMLVRSSSTAFQRAVSVVTDANGQAQVGVAMGHVAGAARVVVAAPALALADTATFTVKPGMPARLAVAPRDTAVYVDGGFALRVEAADRWQNAVPGQVTYTARSTAATVAGGTVSGAAAGRTHVVVQAGALLDSVAVSVVPRGVLVAHRNFGWQQNAVVTFGLDGSQLQVVSTDDLASRPRFMPDGSIVLTRGSIGDLQRIGPDGILQPFRSGGDIPGATWPHPSRDGEWVYFTQFDEFYSRATPMRVRRDGSVLEPVPGLPGFIPNRGYFSPSPDGTHLAYFAELAFDSRNVAVRVSRIGSTDVLVETPGHAPEWSPTGEWIAYLYTNGRETGPLRLMRPDGTGIRTLDAAKNYKFGMDWSPDGKWLVAATSGGLELVNAETGQVIPLPYSAGMLEPSWKP